MFNPISPSKLGCINIYEYPTVIGGIVKLNFSFNETGKPVQSKVKTIKLNRIRENKTLCCQCSTMTSHLLASSSLMVQTVKFQLSISREFNKAL